MKWYQQGDVILEPVNNLPKDGKRLEPNQYGYVLAEGEVTNHRHVIDKVADIEFIEKDGLFYIQNKQPITIKHEEHKPIVLPSGIWKVRGVKEYDHFKEEARRVID